MRKIIQIKNIPRRAAGGACPSPSRFHAIFLFYLVAIVILGLFSQSLARADDEIAELTAMLQKEPHRVDLLKQRAALYRLEERPLDSLLDLNRAHELDPRDREIRLLRGVTLSKMKRDHEAEAELNAFLALESGVARAAGLAERGGIRARTGRLALGLDDYNAAIAIRPALELYLARGRIQESIGQRGAAASGYREAISRLGRAPALIEALIRVYVAQREFQSALSVIDQELVRSPVKTLWLLRRAEVLKAAGQNNQAHAELTKALAEANRALRTRMTGLNLLSRARVLAAMGFFGDAKSDLESCLSLAPNFADCRDLLAQL